MSSNASHNNHQTPASSGSNASTSPLLPPPRRTTFDSSAPPLPPPRRTTVDVADHHSPAHYRDDRGLQSVAGALHSVAQRRAAFEPRAAKTQHAALTPSPSADSRTRIHSAQQNDMKEIAALREVIDKKLGDPDQQRVMDIVFAQFVDSLREAQVAGMSEADVLKTLDSPVRFSGAQFIDWAVQNKSPAAAKSSEGSSRPEIAPSPPSPAVPKGGALASLRGEHEAHLLILVRSGCIQPGYQTTPPSLDCPEAIFEIDGLFRVDSHRSSLPSAQPWQVIITPDGDISYGCSGTPLTKVLVDFSKMYFERFPGRTNFMAQEFASWLLETRTVDGANKQLVSSTEKALAIGKRMVLHEMIVPCQPNTVFPQVCAVSSKMFHLNLQKISKNFKYDDIRYFVNPVALYGKDLNVDGNIRKTTAAASSSSHRVASSGRSRSYTVIVRTDTSAGGGTSGPVYITLMSHVGCTPEQQLQSTFSNAFDRAEEHIYTVVAPQDIGMPTHVMVRLAPTADPWKLHSLIVCDEFFSENSRFIYKDWLKPTYLSVTLGSQGSFSPNGAFIPHHVSSQKSRFSLTITKLEKMVLPEGFAQLLLKFDDLEVGFIDLAQYHAPFSHPTVLPSVQCDISLPVCSILSSNQFDEDEAEPVRIELFACKREDGNPQLQTQFLAMSEFRSQMISMTGMRKGCFALQLKGIEEKTASSDLNPSTVSLAFEEKQDVNASSLRPQAPAWMMPAEFFHLKMDGIQFMCGHLGVVWSNLIITNFRLRLEPLGETTSLGSMQIPSHIDMPLAFVRNSTFQSFEGSIKVKIKTFDDTFKLWLLLNNVSSRFLKQWVLSISKHIVNLSLLGSRPPWRFVREHAVCYRAAGGTFPDQLHSHQSEFQRFGITSLTSYWRETHANASLHRDVCPSYPAILAVPTSVNDNVVTGAALFRSSGRFPCLSWAPPLGQAVRASYGFICRSSQPNVGVFDHTSPDDEKLIKAMTGIKGRLIIFDCRPEINATANKAKGKGSVKSILSNYPGVMLEFLDIENIHCVREAHTKLAKTVENMNSELGEFDDKNFWSSVTDSKWLNYLGDIISGSLKVVRNVASGTGALVHCSDGWDRTPQITSLSSIILDPYYRTAHGFFILIEKEWCNMGHKFADRLNNSIKTDQEESPVFLQWLDCVWQVWRQCPVAFEFNEVMLLHLADQLYSGRWMHFTHNCNHEMEKEAALDAMSSAGSSASSPSFACAFLDLVKDTTRSSEVLNGMELKPQFRNDKYAPQLCDGVLFVSGHERSLQIWPYHFRWISSTIHSHLHPDPVTAELPSPSYLMNVAAASASVVSHSDALDLLEQILPGSSHAIAHMQTSSTAPVQSEWLQETTSNGTSFWRNKTTNNVQFASPNQSAEASRYSNPSAVTWQRDSESDCCSL